MLTPPKPFALFLGLALSFFSCTSDEAAPVSEKNAPTENCACESIFVGSYFFDGSEIWVVNESQLPLPPNNEFFSVNILWDENAILFKSEEFEFCPTPINVWTYSDLSLQDLHLHSCEALLQSAECFDEYHTLQLTVDEEFLNCALESEMAGFKFAVSVR